MTRAVGASAAEARRAGLAARLRAGASGAGVTVQLPAGRRVSSTCVSRAIATEHQEQVTVVQWAAVMAAHGGEWKVLDTLAAVPNGGQRSAATAGRLRAEGVRAGVPDLLLLGAQPPLAIELKRRRGGTVRESQRWWHARLRECGWRVEVCRGADEAIDALKRHIGGAWT